jgi:protocatechuate 3,4-dioxygenase alpha subunit
MQPTPSQTVGPFFSFGLCTEPPRELGSIPFCGRIFDGNGDAVPDAMVELWHPDLGWARCGTTGEGDYAFTIERVPYLSVQVFARGLLKQLYTRVFFDAGAGDELLRSLEDEDRTTLVAQPDGDGYRFDIHLQGDRQTAFFAL